MSGLSSRLAIGAASLAALAAAAVLAVPAAHAGSHRPGHSPRHRDFFAVPPAAFMHPLGEFPADGPCSTYDLGDTRCTHLGVGEPAPFANANPPSQPGLGVPLGGVGAGSFMVNQAGTFGPWDFGGQDELNFENRILPQAAFHLREHLSGHRRTVRTLAVNKRPWDQLPRAWRSRALRPGQGSYAALYPFGWTSYTPFAADVSMRFWSPIIAGNDEQTSMPVAFFDVRLANHTADTDHLSVMFTMPNAPEHVGGYWQLPAGKLPATVRRGLSSRVQHDRRSGVTGVTLSASDPHNTVDARDSDWTIAARPGRGQHVSFTTSWNAAGSGHDVMAPFARTGRLPDRALERSRSAGAIAVRVALRPGQVATIPFALAWDFPEVTFSPTGLGQHLGLGNAVLGHLPSGSGGSSLVWMRRYTSYFGATENRRNDYVRGSYPFHRGFAIADRELSRRLALLRGVRRWWRPIVSDPAYPPWLTREALNELTQMVFNDSFWESGLVTKTRSPRTRIGAAIPGTHMFFTRTGGGWAEWNEWDTDIYGYLAEAAYWPDLERDRLRAVLQTVRQGTLPTLGSRAAGSLDFQDVPMITILRAFAYLRHSGNRAFLRFAYPAMVDLYDYLAAGIKPGDHIPPDYPGQSSTYDLVEVVGHGVYNAELWLLTDEIMDNVARRAGTLGLPGASRAFQKQIRSNLAAAKSEFESLFWDPVGHHYKIDAAGSYGDGIFLSTLFAQHFATSLHLPPLVNRQHEVDQLQTAYPKLMHLKDSAGHEIGPPLVVTNGGQPFPTPCANEICEVWQGAAMFAAATYAGEGRRLHLPVLVRDGLRIAHVIEYQTTENTDNGYLFDPPESWYDDSTATYRSPEFNRSRAGIEVLDSLAALPGAFPHTSRR
ncbi:MAG TPA: GH116 family glycosyl-hydrolase [Mycobacteriales bacterium]|nr:GH116 family glycosyl-hydrolase [Mycobacteriales bacterium]